MGTVSYALNDCQDGEYQWGERDCLSTLHHVVDTCTPYDSLAERAEYWRDKSYLRSYINARKEYGSLKNAYVDYLQNTPGLQQVDADASPRPGDVVLLLPVVFAGQSQAKDTMMAFTDDSYYMFVWTKERLHHVTTHGGVTHRFRLILE